MHPCQIVDQRYKCNDTLCQPVTVYSITIGSKLYTKFTTNLTLSSFAISSSMYRLH